MWKRNHPGDNPGNTDGFLSQLQFKCYLLEEASVGDWLKIYPWVASMVETRFMYQRGERERREREREKRLQSRFALHAPAQWAV